MVRYGPKAIKTAMQILSTENPGCEEIAKECWLQFDEPRPTCDCGAKNPMSQVLRELAPHLPFLWCSACGRFRVWTDRAGWIYYRPRLATWKKEEADDVPA